MSARLSPCVKTTKTKNMSAIEQPVSGLVGAEANALRSRFGVSTVCAEVRMDCAAAEANALK